MEQQVSPNESRFGEVFQILRGARSAVYSLGVELGRARGGSRHISFSVIPLTARTSLPRLAFMTNFVVAGGARRRLLWHVRSIALQEPEVARLISLAVQVAAQ